jgi:hypothetical protein
MTTFAASGQTISFSDINVAHGRSSTATVSLNDTDVRQTAQRTTAGASLGIGDHLAGKARCVIVLSANENGVDLKTKCIANGYVSGSTYVTCTVNSGVVIGGTAANSNSALVVGGFQTSDVVELINRGEIIGYGGYGGGSGGGSGGFGGTGITLSSKCTITNYGTIAGGGGGGAGGQSFFGSSKFGPSYSSYGGPGGGGAGVPGGAAGVLSGASQNAVDGTKTAGGAGGVGYGSNSGPGNNGASAGNLGSAGNSSAANSFTFGPLTIGPQYAGGSAGWAYRMSTTEGAASIVSNQGGTITGNGGVF